MTNRVDKKALYSKVEKLVIDGLELMEIMEIMEKDNFKIDRISNNGFYCSKWIGLEHINVSVFYGDCIKNIHVF